MTSAVIDTLKFARTLRERAKLSPEQAEGLADAIAEAFQNDVATKADVFAASSGLRAEIREAELRLKADIEASKAELVKWMFGTIGFQTLIVLGAVVALSRAVHP